MCGESDGVESAWQREPPNTPGEWLWVARWDCGCMWRCGIAWVIEADYGPDEMLRLPSGLKMSWEGPPLYEAEPHNIERIDGWRRILLPPVEWIKE